MISDTAQEFKRIIDKGATVKPVAPVPVSEQILNKIGSIINGLKQVLNNQTTLNSKLNEIYGVLVSKGNNNNVIIVDHMTQRQLYLCYKRGYSLDQISLVSGYDSETIMNKINIYMRDNT